MQAPMFSLPDQTNKIHHLSDYKGKWVVLYFYPKDDTPGCTVEACSFRDENQLLQKNNIVVLGISKDSVMSHEKFVNKFKLNFPLLSDETKETIKVYGAWGEKKFMGRTFEGIQRNTYIIDPNGNIVKSYMHVDPKKHTKTVIDDLSELIGKKIS